MLIIIIILILLNCVNHRKTRKYNPQFCLHVSTSANSAKHPLPGSIQGIPQQPGPILFMPPTMPNGPNDVPMPVTPQMILANMNETNQRMQRLELIINDKLSKLDLLDVLNDKLGKFEQNLSNMQTEIVNIKSVQ